MKKLTVVSILALVSLGVSNGCHFAHGSVRGSGVRKTQTRELGSFKALDIAGAYEVEVTGQKPVSLAIEADDNILPLIHTDVRDGVLYVRNEQPYRSNKMVALKITVPNLESLKTTGAGEFHISDLKNDRFTIDSTGAATVTASGETKTVEIRSTGAGQIDTDGLHAQKVTVNTSGAASVDVNASEQLDVDVSGVGHVGYSGDPKVNKHVSGAGVVSKKD